MKRFLSLICTFTLLHGESQKPIEKEDKVNAKVVANDPEKTDLEKLIESASPSIVHLEVEGSEGTSTGSGFFIKDIGLVATNFHVVEGATKITATTKSGLKLFCKGVLNLDEEHDLAVLKFAGKNFPALSISDQTEYSIGQKILVIGSPQGLEQTVSDGILSAEREISGWELIQITAPISKGSSGSPVMNMKGNVVGVATFYHSQGQNLNFASASSHLKVIYDSLDYLELVELEEAFPEKNITQEEVQVPPKVEPVAEYFEEKKGGNPSMNLTKGASTYMLSSGNGYVWNNNYRNDDVAIWKGEYDDDGYATGFGYLGWSKTSNKNVKWIYEGTMIKGKFEGEVTCTDSKTGSIGEGLYIKGVKSGTWHYHSSKSGKRWKKEY